MTLLPVCSTQPSASAAELNASCTLPSQRGPTSLLGVAVAAEPVFVARADLDAMAAIVHAVESVVGMPAWREVALAGRPEGARHAPGNPGVLYGYDFHLSPAGPQLIEINTNAGGALICAELLRLQSGCCEAPGTLPPPLRAEEAGRVLVDSLLSDYALARGEGAKPTFAAIVDESPAEQYMYPEFLLFAEQLRDRGVESDVLDPREIDGGAAGVWWNGRRIDLIYNRLTDFWLAADHLAPLRDAWLADAVVVTPHPHGYALYADKRNLAVLSNADELAALGVPSAVRELLVAGIPSTMVVDPAHGDLLWRERNRLYFKPAGAYGGRGTYSGAKLTRATFERLLGEEYVAQTRVPPTTRRAVIEGVETELKIDLRCFVYRGEVQLVAARLYRGQTTNFRTPGGGFAAVLPTAC